MTRRSQWSILIAVLALLGAVAAFSFHTTAELTGNLKTAGINPQSLHPYRPVSGPHHSG